MGYALTYLYVAGVLNGLLILGLDKERIGEMPSMRKIVYATVLWPALFPLLWFSSRGKE